MNTTGKIMTAALIGAAAGAVAALLLAPASGKETREKVKESFAAAKDKVAGLISRGKEAAEDLKDETRKASRATL